MKIGLLVAGVLPDTLVERFGHYGVMYEELLEGQGFDFIHYDVRGGQMPASVDEADGWIVTGSKNGAYEDLPWINALKETLKSILLSGTPIVGICFGHQILAQVLGGKVEQFGGGWMLGRQSYQLQDGRELHAMAWHQDQVVELPQGARLLASSEGCKNAMFAYGDQVLGIQPHPEFDADVVRRALKSGAALPDDRAQTAKDTANLPVDRSALVDMVSEFLNAGHGPAKV